MVKNSGDTQARFLVKSLAVFYWLRISLGRELPESMRIRKALCRRFAQMRADPSKIQYAMMTGPEIPSKPGIKQSCGVLRSGVWF
jgi:hypothetical protein